MCMLFVIGYNLSLGENLNTSAKEIIASMAKKEKYPVNVKCYLLSAENEPFSNLNTHFLLEAKQLFVIFDEPQV